MQYDGIYDCSLDRYLFSSLYFTFKEGQQEWKINIKNTNIFHLLESVSVRMFIASSSRREARVSWLPLLFKAIFAAAKSE